MSKASNLIGKTFGRLTVVARGPNLKSGQTQWKCWCTCGKEKLVSSSSLNLGKTKSCGCLVTERKLIPDGAKFGLLTVVGTETPEKNRESRCKVICECRKAFIVNSSALKSGHTLGCGKNCPVKNADSSKKQALKNYKSGAKLRGLEWKLTDEEFFTLVSQDCFYCGSEPSNTCKVKSSSSVEFVYNGVDRVDNTLGYVLDNCVACCKDCNLSKRGRPCGDFISWAHRLSEHLRSKNL